MMQRKRETLGFAFDPTVDDDIHMSEEYSSSDYDSDDLHSSVHGDSSDDVSSEEDTGECRVQKCNIALT